jgi:release factor glutamine methyltransferase
MPEVKDHEPKLALDAGATGLIFYERIINDLNRYLNPGGYVFFEIGYDQGKDVSRMLYEAGFIDITVKKDYSDLDRIVYARKVSG